MRKKTWMICLLLCLGWQLQAQEKEENSREVERYTWDIGTDLLFLINKNVVPPSLFVRWNREKDNKLSAYRFRLGADFAQHLNPNKIDTSWAGSSFKKTAFTLFSSVGKEWQKQFNQFQLFYGADVFLQYTYEVYEGAILFGKDYYPRNRNLITGISPFVGMKFFIHSRISLSAEAHANMAYNSMAIHSFDAVANPPTPSKLTANFFQLRFNQPLYVFQLSYHF
ncbi:hypothetical protein Q0590_35860 [Rhodocytophaga aerolata]|uniref:DUF3575 domain-containing protein n=1 Tax=Rhodocytophaga aerolata TaxID=455078 RepID=A0ABT8RKN9_9BACT|nr:hypothetical protein [Rhodocytophaga aerolata]MDO1451705.1 hypothetical protein [Rhodocytophaga aerolata]